MPYLLDHDPHLPGQRTNAHQALRTLMARLRKNHPTLSIQIIADSAFGSFTTIEQMRDLGINATFSMSPNHKRWLWELLAWDCPLTSGRTALLPIRDGEDQAVVSLFHVKSETDKIIDIRTLSTSFTWTIPDAAEGVVTSVGTRRTNDIGIFEYETHWADGSITWQQARTFMDPDGTFNISWLRNADAEDVRDALVDLNADELAALCDSRGWKVLPLFSSLSYF